MTGTDLARDLLLLATDCALSVRSGAPEDDHWDWPDPAGRFTDLGTSLRDHVGRPGDALWARSEELNLASPDRWLLYLCAAVEMHPEAAAAASILAEDEHLYLPTALTFARLMRVALGLHFSATLTSALPGCAVERFGLLDRLSNTPRPVSQQGLRLSAVGARLLTDPPGPAPYPETATVRHEAPAATTAFPTELVHRLVDLLDTEGIVCVSTRSARAGVQVALDAACLRKEPAILVEPRPDTAPDPAWMSGLRGGLVVLDAFPMADERRSMEPQLRRLGADLPGLVAVVPENVTTGSLSTLDVTGLGASERRRIWSTVMAGEGGCGLAARFGVSLPEARDAVRAAEGARAKGSAGPPDVTEVASALCAQGARRMGRKVTRLRPRAGLGDLVAPEALRQNLLDIIDAHRTRSTVYDDWAMGSDSELGRGLVCLFAGPPGTGKTFAAQCLASELALNLYRIDLSQVVSKYIGETEKALAAIFDEAEAGHGILLFDEADALFGKRTEVTDAHDRYANIEIDYLLQRMEAYNDGISILTTNVEENIDRAFYRRLSFVLHFPIPDVELRRRLWGRFLPPADRRAAGLNVEPFVQRYALAGANIRNIGIAAAHMAAAAPEGTMTSEHLLRATFRELEKAGLARSLQDFEMLAAAIEARA